MPSVHEKQPQVTATMMIPNSDYRTLKSIYAMSVREGRIEEQLQAQQKTTLKGLHSPELLKGKTARPPCDLSDSQSRSSSEDPNPPEERSNIKSQRKLLRQRQPSTHTEPVPNPKTSTYPQRSRQRRARSPHPSEIFNEVRTRALNQAQQNMDTAEPRRRPSDANSYSARVLPDGDERRKEEFRCLLEVMKLEFSRLWCSKLEAEARADELQTRLLSGYEEMEAEVASLEADNKKLRCEAENREMELAETSLSTQHLEKKERSLKKRLAAVTRAKESAEQNFQSISELNKSIQAKLEIGVEEIMHGKKPKVKQTSGLTKRFPPKTPAGSERFMGMLKRASTRTAADRRSTDTTDDNTDAEASDAFWRGDLEQYQCCIRKKSMGSIN